MNNANVQPVTITSDYAEIIYFLRNGNLYRRVLLSRPSSSPRSTRRSITPTHNGQHCTPWPLAATQSRQTGPNVSWQGVNDLSARSSRRRETFRDPPIVLNTLGDLTNRENRFATSRFANDFTNIAGTAGSGPDGFPDDLNGDNVPDFYPTLYAGVFQRRWAAPDRPLNAANRLAFEPAYPAGVCPAFRTRMAFP